MEPTSILLIIAIVLMAIIAAALITAIVYLFLFYKKIKSFIDSIDKGKKTVKKGLDKLKRK